MRKVILADFMFLYKAMENKKAKLPVKYCVALSRGCLGDYTSVKQIWNQEKSSLERATRLISHLEEDQINVGELEEILKELFEEDVNLLKNVNPGVRTNVRRLILIYDYLK